MHVHSHGPASGRQGLILKAAAVATLGYVLLAFAAGLYAHSLALLSEAGHNLTDFLALIVSWVGVYLQSKPPTESKTFGYHRAGVLAALLNVVTLVVLTVFIVVGAIVRLQHPVAVATRPMLLVAAVGVLMNGVIAALLHRGKADVNVRGAFLHMVGDALSTALVIVGALVIAATGKVWVDPALSLLIAAFILWSSWGVLHETLNILLEGSPRGVATDQVCHALEAVEGVEEVHDMHIWSLGSQAHALSCHVRIADIPPSESDSILRCLQQLLADRYNIRHSTIQFENSACAISHGCVIPVHEHRAG